MKYLDLLYVYLPPADRLDCRISIKMASQPCGGIIANTVRVFTAKLCHIPYTYFDGTGVTSM